MDCKFKTVDGITLAGANILKALLQNRADGGAVGKLAGGSGALPKAVAKWIREEDCRPVIWQVVKREYQLASELHADIAARFKKQIDDLSSKPRAKKGEGACWLELWQCCARFLLICAPSEIVCPAPGFSVL